MEQVRIPSPSDEETPKTDEPTNSRLLPWIGIILAVLLSGFAGFLIGRLTAEAEVSEMVASGEKAIATSIVRTNADDAPSLAPFAPTPASIASETLTTMGDPNAPVTIVEFSDYQCPFCLRNFQQTWPQLKAEYIDTGRVYYVFKDFPIPSLHPVAERVHEAAQCAGEIGGRDTYWEVHDVFFINQEQWADKPQPDLDNILVSLTDEAGIANDEMRSCLDSGRHAEAVQADMAEGRALGVNGTPTFYIDGYPVVGAQPYQVFQTALSMAEEGRLAEAFTQQPGPDDGKARATETALAAQPVDVPMGDAPAKGDPNAPVTIIEYSDFQCPFCLRHFENTMPELQSYIDAGKVRYVFKDFPIRSSHPQAQKAHESARCARELGGEEAFWEMHDLIFANQDEWAGNGRHVELFKSLASEIDIAQEEFDECLDSGRYADAVNSDLAEGQRFGVTGTPSFFINGQRLVGAQPLQVFQQIIESMLVSES
ncbi:MAG: thioredoxin domain-containing protein [Candidatus Promineifilaceae bacterium]